MSWPLRRRIPAASVIATTLAVAATIDFPALAQEKPAAVWTAPRTPDGQPDLQGTWTNATLTPLERPASFAGRATMTEQEAAQVEAQALRRFQDGAADRRSEPLPPRAGGAVGSYNQAVWSDSAGKVVSTRQTSLVIDPPDGRVPLRPEAERVRERRDAQMTDSYEFFNVFDRCITRGVPGAMFQAPYNNGYQIFQSPGFVVILAEMIHEARIIPLDRKTHLPSSMRSMTGDSIGHWEGGTLVVDTTNYNDRGSIATASTSGRIRGIPQTEALHVVERFTRTGADTIIYTVTIEDPTVYTRPWTVSMPLERDASYRIFEYACHEGNYAVPNMLRAARQAEREAAPPAAGR